MIKVFLTLYLSLFLQRPFMSPCHAINMNGTIFVKDYIGYFVNIRESNLTKLKEKPSKVNDFTILTNSSIRTNENVLNEDLKKSYDFVVPFKSSSFTVYKERQVQDIKRQIQYEGNYKMSNLAYSINRHLNGNVYIFSTLKNITKDYTNEVDAYFDYMIKQKITCQIEEEFYVLDFIETANKIFAEINANL